MHSRVLGRYVVYEAFAQGGMATVHYGRLLGPSGFSRTVAIKRLHAHLAEDPEFVAMFLDEARLAARIHHPNVIQTLDVESSEGELSVVLEYVQGDSLSRLLHEARRAGAPPPPAILGAILFGALEGLHAAHEARDANGEPLDLVHRDVSPHNVLVGSDGVARVLDFGVAKARGRAQTTRGGQIKGKLSYMAPEQLRGKVTRRSDVFAASVVLWEGLTGRRLFEGDDEGDVMDRVLHAPIPPPRTLAPDVTPAMEAIVMRGLARDPARRFATAHAMALALHAHGPLATPLEVAAFVERAGGATLAERAARVARIEREDVDRSGRAPQSDDESAGTRAPSPARRGDASVATAPVPGLARAAPAIVPESVGTGAATVSEKRAPSRHGIGRATRVASLALLAGLGLALFAALRFGAPAGAAAATQADAPPIAASTAAAASITPLVTAVTTGAAPSIDAVVPRSSPVDPPAKKPAPTRPRARPGCSPAYTVDARGVRHYKAECL
jgi:serine/threonine-protein kinase